MNVELLKQDILQKIREIAERDRGRAPGRDKFLAETGVKPHQWRGKIWRVWGDALAEAGYAPNELQPAFEDSALLEVVCQISKRLNRFPSTSDIEYEVPRLENGPNPKTIMARWKMAELANALAAYAAQRGEVDVEQFARDYVSPRSTSTAIIDPESAATGFVYLQRHGTDYKIGFTTSLNKRGRQIQIELPQEIELVHSILTDDPRGIETYWHQRFAAKRTRGEWFKLTKADVAAFKRWTKIW